MNTGRPPGVGAGLLAWAEWELDTALLGELVLAAVAFDEVTAKVLKHVVVAREGLGAPVVRARERLLSGVLADVATIVLKSLKGPLAVFAGELQPVGHGLGAAAGCGGRGPRIFIAAEVVGGERAGETMRRHFVAVVVARESCCLEVK